MTNDTNRLDTCQYDAIVIGTGLPESILSSALSLSGVSVLQLDPNSVYGSRHSTLTVGQVNDLICLELESGRREQDPSAAHENSSSSAPVDKVDTQYETVEFVPLNQKAQLFPYDVKLLHSTADNHDFSDVAVDLSSYVLLGAGHLVDLLVETGAGHYTSFYALDASLLYFPSMNDDDGCGGRLERVPGSRSDVFQSSFLTNIEKRLLMRFQKSLLHDGNDLNEAKPIEDLSSDKKCRTFESAMREAGLTPNLKYFLQNSIVFANDLDKLSASPLEEQTLSELDGREMLHVYHRSLVRYGAKTPYLYPSYGFGEVCEAFCRLSAVYGCTFVLRKQIQEIRTNCTARADFVPAAELESSDCSAEKQSYCVVLTADGETLHSQNVFVSQSVIRMPAFDEATCETGRIWRVSAILDGSALGPHVARTLAVFPRGSCGNLHSSVRVLQLPAKNDSSDRLYVLSAWTTERGATESDILSVFQELVESDRSVDAAQVRHMYIDGVDANPRPSVRWSIVFSRPFIQLKDLRSSIFNAQSALPQGIIPVYDVACHMGISSIIKESFRCFNMAFPQRKFFGGTSWKNVL